MAEMKTGLPGAGADSRPLDDDGRRAHLLARRLRRLQPALLLVPLFLAGPLVFSALGVDFGLGLAPFCSKQSSVGWPSRLVCVASASSGSSCRPSPHFASNFDDCEKGDPGRSLDRWLQVEREIAWRGIVDNIGPAAGASTGLVIASPSRAHPDYFFTWTRDAALTMSTVLGRFLPAADAGEPELEPLLREYVASQASLQIVQTRSGGLCDGGLGEPKFTVEGAAFEGDWGRPQRDGPALRALVTGRFASFLLGRARPLDETYVRATLYDADRLITPDSVLKSDLEYIAHNSREPSFDIWEEVSGSHFFTLLASRTALLEGSRIAQRLGDGGAARFYEEQVEKLDRALEPFWIPEEGYISAMSTPRAHGRTGVDAAVLLAVLRAGPLAAANETRWSEADDRVLATVERYVSSFAGDLYAINRHKNKDWHGAIAVGRYAEDVYDGVGKSAANPWFITTFSVGEILYRIAAHALTSGRITISPVSLVFWQTIDGRLSSGQVLKRASIKAKIKNGRFERVVDGLLAYADGFLRVGQTFAGPNGTLSEQFHRLDGSPTGAQNLTWSYASLLEAADARQRAYDLRFLA